MIAIRKGQVNSGKCCSLMDAHFSGSFYRLFVIIFGLMILLSDPVKSQEAEGGDAEVETFINKADAIYGVDDELINGYPYRPPQDLIQFHPYYGRESWQRGTLYMNGETFRNKRLKYDLVEDAMILKADLQDGVTKLIHLNSLHVDSVRLGNHLFVHSRKYYPSDSIETYYQEVFAKNDGALALIIHHSKKFHSQYTELAPKGRFSNVNTERMLIRNGKTYKVSHRRSFLKIFEKEKRRKLRKFMNRKDIRYRKASTKQLDELMKFCSSKLMM